jgi:hypothetical protein
MALRFIVLVGAFTLTINSFFSLVGVIDLSLGKAYTG